ncbi:MAG: hypothetical protein POELPBGB_00108 [Bacteroidia bacterium]|nr:hypothetical protein [Bacteroidia bacterium]
MAIPIFFVHKTNSSYLKYALKQARKYNPDSAIYLLGDDENNQYPFITHVAISDYSKSADEFKKVYRHMSATNIDYELVCFLRWFYIMDFAEKNGIESFIYLDSDVLVFSNLTDALKPFESLSIANEGLAMPAFTYFGNKTALVDFCSFMMQQYTKPHYLNRLESEWEIHKPKNWGGICDMVMFQFYFEEHPQNLGKLDEIINDSVFDQHIRTSDGFEMKDDHKKIAWKNGQPFGFHLQLKKWIRFHGIHYQGHSKALMYKHYKGGGFYIHRLKEYLQDLRDNYQIRTKIKNFFDNILFVKLY